MKRSYLFLHFFIDSVPTHFFFSNHQTALFVLFFSKCQTKSFFENSNHKYGTILLFRQSTAQVSLLIINEHDSVISFNSLMQSSNFSTSIMNFWVKKLQNMMFVVQCSV